MREDDWQDGDAGGRGRGERAGLEGQQSGSGRVVVPGALGEDEHPDVPGGGGADGVAQEAAGVGAARAVDEGGAGQPGAGAEGAGVHELPLGHDGAAAHQRPQAEQAQHVDGVLVVHHDDVGPRARGQVVGAAAQLPL